MSGLNLIKKKDISASIRVAPQPTDLGDVISAAIDYTRDVERINSESANQWEEQDRRDKRYKDLTGRDITLDALAYAEKNELGLSMMPTNLRRDDPKMQEAIDRLLEDMHNKQAFGQETILNSKGIEEAAKQRALDSTKKLQQAMAGTTRVQGIAGNFIGGFVGMLSDPVNVATMLLGAGAGRTLLKTIMIEAGLNAGVEAVSQPFVQEWKKEVGLEHGFVDSMENIGMAFLFGGSFPLAARGIGLTPNLVGKVKASSSEIFDRMSTGFKKAGLHEEASAATALSRKSQLDESNPSKLNDDFEHKNYVKDMEEVNAAVKEGRPIDSSKIKLDNFHVRRFDVDKAADAMKPIVRMFQEEGIPPGALQRLKDRGMISDKPKQRNPVLAEDKKQVPTMESQKEMEDLIHSEPYIAQERNDFMDNVDDNLPMEWDKDFNVTQRASDYKRLVEEEESFIEAIRTCRI